MENGEEELRNVTLTLRTQSDFHPLFIIKKRKGGRERERERERILLVLF